MPAVQNAVGKFIISPPYLQCNDIPAARGDPGAPMPTYNTRITCREISLGSHVAGISSNFHPSREKTQHARGASSFSLLLLLLLLLQPPVAARINASPRDIAGILLLLVPLHSVHRLSPSRLSLFPTASASRGINYPYRKVIITCITHFFCIRRRVFLSNKLMNW